MDICQFVPLDYLLGFSLLYASVLVFLHVLWCQGHHYALQNGYMPVCAFRLASILWFSICLCACVSACLVLLRTLLCATQGCHFLLRFKSIDRRQFICFLMKLPFAYLSGCTSSLLELFFFFSVLKIHPFASWIFNACACLECFRDGILFYHMLWIVFFTLNFMGWLS